MNRSRTAFVLAPLLALLACDANTTAPELDSEVSAAGNVEVSSEIPGGPFGPFQVTYTFMPYPDGYQFKNFGGAADWELFSDVFGGHVHIWSLPDMAYFNNSFVPSYSGGVCYGFAMTAGMFHRGVYGPDPGYFAPDALETWDIPQGTRGGGGRALDEGIERHILKYYYYQVSPQIWRHRIGSYSAAYGELLVNAVEAAQDAGWPDLWVLGFHGPWGGHAVNILNVERTEAGATFTVWDNNAPFSETNDPGFREFHWSPDGYTYYTKTVSKANVKSVGPHERDHLDKWWGDPSFADFYVLASRILDPSILVVHTDAFGQRLGRTATAEFDNIPGAYEVVLQTGAVTEGWEAPVQYHLPMGDYSIDLLSPESGDLAYQLFAGDAMFSLATEGSGLSTGRVSNFIEGGAFAFETQDPVEGVQAQVVRVLSAEEERALDVDGLFLPADGSLRITPAEDAGSFNIQFEGVPEALCELSLTRASPDGLSSLAIPEVRILEGASVELEPWSWDRLDEMPVFLRTHKPDGEVLLEVGNATATSLWNLLQDLVATGALPNRATAFTIRLQVRVAHFWVTVNDLAGWLVRPAPYRPLRRYLNWLVAEGKISTETADLILATAKAAAPESA
jgi:hypothetical protein